MQATSAVPNHVSMVVPVSTPSKDISANVQSALEAKPVKEVSRTLNGSGVEVIKRFPASTQLSMKYQLLIKTKMLTN